MHRPPSAITVRPEPFDAAGPRWVVARAEEELVARYGWLDDSELGLIAAMFAPPAGGFLVAFGPDDRAPHPVGGVGVRRLEPGTGEVKRLWVEPSRRGHGVGRSLMDALEGVARDLGLVTMHLGTGDRQPEAVALYESMGWERLHHDADGRPVPPRHVRFVKRLAPPAT
jgi:GNAT superfamily N-acetyltransferase